MVVVVVIAVDVSLADPAIDVVVVVVVSALVAGDVAIEVPETELWSKNAIVRVRVCDGVIVATGEAVWVPEDEEIMVSVGVVSLQNAPR